MAKKPKKKPPTPQKVLESFDPWEGDDGSILLATGEEGLLVRVVYGDVLLPVDVIDEDSSMIAFDSTNGAPLSTVSPCVEAHESCEEQLRSQVSSMVSLAKRAVICVECESPLVNRGGDLECSTCGLAINPDCPKCGARMSILFNEAGNTGFWGCRGTSCRAAVRWGNAREKNSPEAEFTEVGNDDREQEIAEAADVLEHPLIADFDVAIKLRKLLDEDPEKVLPLVLGDKTPGGKPTVEARLDARIAKQKGKKRRVKVKGRKRAKAKQATPGEKRSGIAYYDSSDAPPGEKGCSVLEIPEEGGHEVSSSVYPHHELKHEKLNPIQTAVLDFYDKDCNVVVAASTSAGKTLSAEILMGDALDRGAKAIFLSPLRAVSQEKHDDWTDDDHPWSELGVSICTGDYQMTKQKRTELRRADVIVMTSEMLDSKTRRMNSEENSWLRDTLCLVVDEAHLLTMDGRGDALEVGLMRFAKQNPHCRIVLLSATMPNVHDLGGWLTRLNGKPTRVIESKWRPTKLTIHTVTYQEASGYGAYNKNEELKRERAIRLIQEYPDDKWIVFVHTKKAGHALMAQLRDRHEPCEFHSADLERDKRLRLEDKFRNGDLRVVIATSTLAYGINMPARRVCVLGITRGLSKVDPIDVQQEFGRAGRVGLDPEGDAYLLLPESRSDPRQVERLEAEYAQVGNIESKLNDVNVLAFHLVAEIAEGDVRTKKDAMEWHARSLAAYQGRQLEEEGKAISAARVLSDLSRCGIIRENDDGTYTATELGKVASMLYYSPFDVADWASNFRWAASRDKQLDDDVICWAIGNVRTAYSSTYLPKEHQGDMGDFEWRVKQKGVEKVSGLPPACLAYEGMIRGVTYRGLSGYQRSLTYDLDRVMAAITMIDHRVIKGLGADYCTGLAMRLRYGVSWGEAEMCQIPGVGGRRAKKLVAAGIESVLDVLDNVPAVVEALGQKTAHSVVRGAKEVAKKKGIGRWTRD